MRTNFRSFPAKRIPQFRFGTQFEQRPVVIEELLKRDRDLREYVEKNSPEPSKKKLKPVTLAMKRGGGIVVEGMERIAQAIANGKSMIDAFVQTGEPYLRSIPEASENLAPNGKPSKLTPAQYKQVRTEEFKKYFGDWERLAQQRFLDGTPIASLTGKEFAPDGTPLTEKVTAWFQSEHQGAVERPGFGSVILNKQSVRDSLSHGMGREKASAFAAVPEIIKKGIVLDTRTNWKGRGQDSITIGAPIAMGGKDYVAVAIVQKDLNRNRFYLHEVVLKERLRASFKTEASANKTVALNGEAGAIRSLLQNIYSVNENDVSAVVDENGEPLVVYRGVKGEFRDGDSAVPRARTTGGKGLPSGTTIFTNDRELSAYYAGAKKATMQSDALKKTDQWWAWPPENILGGNVVPAYLSIQNPLIVDAKGMAWTHVEHNGTVSERAIIHEAKKKGYDGVIFRDITDTPEAFTAFGHDQYVVFDRSQIKSAIGNDGGFGKNNNILRKVTRRSDSRSRCPPHRR